MIGTGLSSEPILYYLSKTNLKVLIVDKSDIQFNYNRFKLKNSKISRLTPKQIYSNLFIKSDSKYVPITKNARLSCSRFNYLYSPTSGGLSNFWGGGIFEWSDEDLKKTTSIPISRIKLSYKSIKERLHASRIDKYFQSSRINYLLECNNKVNSILNIKSTEFLLDQKGLTEHEKARKPFDQHLIWNSLSTIRSYINSSNNLIYKPNITVNSITDKKTYKIIKCSSNLKDFEIHAKAIFLCCGTVNSTLLAFSALDMTNACFNLFHNSAAIVPLFISSNIKTITSNEPQLPELTWTLRRKINHRNKLSSSGYIISSSFLFNKLSNISSAAIFKLSNSVFKCVLSRIFFLTIYSNSRFSNTKLLIEKDSLCSNSNEIYSLKIKSNLKIIKFLKSLLVDLFSINNLIGKRLSILYPLVRIVRTGGDVHYTSTMLDGSLIKNVITTNSLGEIDKLENIYVCDPSRLAYNSSLPHSFTSMAIVDASMKGIIRKIDRSD